MLIAARRAPDPDLQQAPPVPEIDPANEQFVVFVRATSGVRAHETERTPPP